MRGRLIPLTVAAVLLLVAQAPLSADTLTETFEETYEVAAGTEVSLRNTNGSISIETWSQNSVQVVAEKRVRARDAEQGREAIEAIEIIVTERNGRLEIETEYPRESTGMFSWLFGRHVEASVSYELRVPASVELDVVTVNGNVSTEGPRGEQRLRSTNGRINELNRKIVHGEFFAPGVPKTYGVRDLEECGDMRITSLSPKRTLPLGPFRIPLGKPVIRAGRRSQPFWKILGDHGIFSNILRVPITFPAEKFGGVLLSAMAVPDLKGSQGTYYYFTSDKEEAARLRPNMTSGTRSGSVK